MIIISVVVPVVGFLLYGFPHRDILDQLVLNLFHFLVYIGNVIDQIQINHPPGLIFLFKLVAERLILKLIGIGFLQFGFHSSLVESRWILLIRQCVELALHSLKLILGEFCCFSLFKLFQSSSDCLIAHYNGLADVRDGALDAMDLGSDQNSSSTQTGWSSAMGHPISLHSLD